MEQEIHFCKTADGVRIAYATAGQGPPLVKAANWLNHLEFDWQSPIWSHVLEEFARDHLFVRYDERGNGLSDWDVDELSLEAFVSDLESVVEALGLERFPILGISQGGPVAITYAVRHPEKVSHLVLYGSYARGWAKRSTPEQIELRHAQLTLIKLGWGQDNAAFRQMWTSLYMPDGTPEQWQWFNEMQKISASPENAVRLLSELGKIDVVDLLPQVKVPTLVLHCRDDAAVPFEAGRLLASSIPGARFIPLEGKNHLLLETAPAWPKFVTEVRAFLGASKPPLRSRSEAPAVSKAESKAPSIGDSIGRYTIKSLLGEGGMGQVYLAEDTKLRRSVALKVLPGDLAANVDRMRRFVQEAQAAAALNHPNIAHIYEIGEDDGVNFIAMEFIDGQTLRQLIHSGPADLSKLLRYLQHAAEGLGKAHAAGIIHRDLKPDNIMVTRDGHAKILDFGLAKLIEAQPISGSGSSEVATAILPQHSQPGTVMGTVGYMSPEQAQGMTRQIDQRSDIFSFGCLLFEAVTRRKAFEGKDAIDSLNKVIREPAPPITDFNQSAPSDLQRIVRRCLAKDPDERYQTIKDVAIELKELRSELKQSGIDTTVAPSRSDTKDASDAQPTAIKNGGATLQSSGSISTRASSADYLIGSFKQHKVAMLIIAVPMLALLIAGIVTLASYLYARNTEVAIDSIAVLPFENQNQDPNSDYLTDGLTESIINSLTQLPNLRVIARSSVFRYKGKAADPLKAGTELGVRAVLTGRLLQRGNDLIVSAELVDLHGNKQLWGERYQRKFSDILQLQEEIAKEITTNLRLRLTGEQQKLVTRHYTENTEAYEVYLKGRYFYSKVTEDDLRKSIEYYQQAIALDPNYALAYVGLANSYATLGGVLGFRSPQETYPQSQEFATKALALDPRLAEAHYALANYKFNYEWNWVEAEREYKRAIELNPNYALAHSGYGSYYQAFGRLDEAIAERKLAAKLDPLSPFAIANVGYPYYYARRYDDAINHYQKALELDPRYSWAHLWIGQAYVQKGMYKEAINEIQQAIVLSNGDIRAKATLGHAFAVAGKRDEALKELAELQRVSRERYVSPYFIALIQVGLHDDKQAFEWLQKAVDEHHPYLTLLRVEPVFDRLRSDARFNDLLQRIGLPP